MVKYKVDYQTILKTVIEASNELGRALEMKDFKKYNIKIDGKSINNYIRKETEYDGYLDFCRKNGFKFKNDVLLDDVYKDTKDLTLDEIKLLFNEYKNKYGEYPTSCTCMTIDRDNLPAWKVVSNCYNKNNMTLNEFLTYIGNSKAVKPDIKEYNKYIEVIKEKCSRKVNKVLEWNDFRNNDWNIPDIRWLLDNCPNKDIKEFSQFSEWLGFKPWNNISKEKAIELILNMQSKSNSPLYYDDFRNPKYDAVGIGAINKIWGSMNKMKAELGLEIIQEDMVCKKITLDEAKRDIIKLCNYIYETENRKLITITDTDKVQGLLDFGTYRKHLKDNNEDIRTFIESIGFELQKEGRGMILRYDDGEVTKSKFEHSFSDYLRNILHLKYNVDYFRDVKYNTFSENYTRRMDCDYIINYNGRKIYIEVAGLLRDYDKYYYENRIINSKSKEFYRLKLMQKEEMLKNISDAEYYILFPINKNYESVLDFDYINKIFTLK